ncbi:hypothetical protein SprV_0902741100 [Sparganum proliferum]
MPVSCCERFTQMVRQPYDGITARVTENGVTTESFAVTNGVKESCVLAPALFSLTFSAMLMDVCREGRRGIRVANRTDVQLLSQRRMHFQSRVSATLIHELLLADDCALNVTSEGDMQRSMDLFSAAGDNFGLAINTEKAVVMHQPPLHATYVAPQINVNGAQLQVADKFTYLNSTLSCNTKIDNEVTRRMISKASQAFGRLRNTM